MRILPSFLIIVAALLPLAVAAQAADPAGEAVHVAVEATTLVLDQERLQRLGLAGMVIASGAAVAAGSGAAATGSTVRVGTRVGDRGVSAWLNLVRANRAVTRESTQRIVTLSGSSARISSGETVITPYGAATGGPDLWIEPLALEDGSVHLRVWTAVGQVRAGPFGTVWQDVSVEARAEIVVPSGTSVIIASHQQAETHSHRGLLERGRAETASQAWIMVTPTVTIDPAAAFEMPEGIPTQWLGRP